MFQPLLPRLAKVTITNETKVECVLEPLGSIRDLLFPELNSSSSDIAVDSSILFLVRLNTVAIIYAYILKLKFLICKAR